MSSARTLTCKELTEVLTDYLEGALPEIDRLRLEEHLAACGKCAVYLEHEEEGRRHPLAWTRTWGASPILADSLGHDAGSYRAPGRALLLQRELDWLLPAA